MKPCAWWLAVGAGLLAGAAVAPQGPRDKGFPSPKPRAVLGLEGHRGWVKAVAYGAGGKLLASGGADRTVMLWDLAAGKRLAVLEQPEAVNAVALTRDGALLAVGTEGNEVRLWDVATGKERAVLKGHAGAVHAVAFSPDDSLLATGSADRTVRLWNVARRTERAALKGHSTPVRGVGFRPDGKTLVSASGDPAARPGGLSGEVILWDVASHKETARLHGDLARGGRAGFTSVAFSPDGSTLAAGVPDLSLVRLWDVATRKPKDGVGGMPALALAFSPDGKTLATAGDSAALNDVASGKPLASFSSLPIPDVRAFLAVAFSPDGKTFAAGCQDRVVRVFDVARRELLLSFPAHLGLVRTVAFHPGGKLLAAGCQEGTVRLWDVERRGLVNTLRATTGSYLTLTAFSRDGARLATGSWDLHARVWDIAAGKTRTVLNSLDLRDPMAFSPDGKQLAARTRKTTVQVWDIDTGKVVATLEGHTAPPECVAFAPDGKMLATAAADGTVRLWSAATGKEKLRLEIKDRPEGQALTGLAFSPDGKTLATAPHSSGPGPRSVVLWDVAGGKRASVLAGCSVPVKSLVFSRDGKRMAAGGGNGAVVWDAQTGQRLSVHQTGEHEDIFAVALSPDGRTLAAGTSRSAVLLWDVPASAKGER
jgi:WD40 repeat protein